VPSGKMCGVLFEWKTAGRSPFQTKRCENKAHITGPNSEIVEVETTAAIAGQ